VDESPSVREALDRLYRAPANEFVALRTELARNLTAAGDRETAKLVKAARKPDRIAAAMNLTVLEDAAPIEAVFAAYDAAEREQRGGDAERWRDLVADYRERVQAATRAVIERAALPSDGTTSRRIAQALSGAAADEAARKHVLSGRVTTLDQDTDPLAALGLASHLAAPPAKKKHAEREQERATSHHRDHAAETDREQAERRREHAAAAKRERAERRREAAEAKREAAKQRREAAAQAKREQAAQRAFAKATERVEALERERRRIDEALTKARADLAQATSAARRT
jgi:hypothetical protein